MQKKIVKAGPMGSGHLMLEFEDGTKQMVHRGDHERHDPKPGDTCPSDGHEHVTEGVQTGALRKKAYVANKIESIEIIPGENGGHRVVHNFKREAGKKEGAIAGGVHMERTKPAEHFFGKSEDGKSLPNVGKVLPPLARARSNSCDRGGTTSNEQPNKEAKFATRDKSSVLITRRHGIIERASKTFPAYARTPM